MLKKVTDCEVPKEERQKARDLIRHLVYARTQEEYKEVRNDLFEVMGKDFESYFLKNWENCPQMWVTWQRDEFLHFGNTTNNRVESSHQKLKNVVLQSSSLAAMFKSLLFIKTAQSEYSHKAFLEEFTSVTTKSSTEHVEVVAISSSCTEYATSLTIEQLNVSSKIEYKVQLPIGPQGAVEVTYGDHHHFVHLKEGTCSCAFSKTMGLPCRHIFVARRKLNLPIFEESMVRKRWLASYQLSVGSEDYVTVDRDDSVPVVIVHELPEKSIMKGTLSRNQKYSKMLKLAQKLATMSCQYGMPEFRESYSESVVERLIDLWEHNVPFSLVATSDVEVRSCK